MATPTNQDLQSQIEKVDGKVERRHRSVMNAISKVRTDFTDALAPVIGYVNDQKAVEKYIDKHSNSATKTMFNWGKVIELLVQALVAALSIIAVLAGTGSIDV